MHMVVYVQKCDFVRVLLCLVEEMSKNITYTDMYLEGMSADVSSHDHISEVQLRPAYALDSHLCSLGKINSIASSESV